MIRPGNGGRKGAIRKRESRGDAASSALGLKRSTSAVHAFLDRPLAGEWPYLWLDATYLKQREGGRL